MMHTEGAENTKAGTKAGMNTEILLRMFIQNMS